MNAYQKYCKLQKIEVDYLIPFRFPTKTQNAALN